MDAIILGAVCYGLFLAGYVLGHEARAQRDG